MPPRGAELAAGRVGVRSIYISRGVDAPRRRRGCVATRPWKTRFSGPSQPSIFASARAVHTGFRVVQTRRYKCDSTHHIARSISLPPPRALTKLGQTRAALPIPSLSHIGGACGVKPKQAIRGSTVISSGGSPGVVRKGWAGTWASTPKSASVKTRPVGGRGTWNLFERARPRIIDDAARPGAPALARRGSCRRGRGRKARVRSRGHQPGSWCLRLSPYKSRTCARP